MTQRISLKDTYDNRDVIAWLVKQKEQIDEILADLDERIEAGDNIEITPSGNQRIISLKDDITGPITFEDRIMCSDYMTSVARAYNAANVDDVVTIGSLASNPNVVHTTGNEEMSGSLTVKSLTMDTIAPASGQTFCVFDNVNPGKDRRARLVLAVLANGNVELYLEKYELSTNTRLGQQYIVNSM